MVRFIKSNNIIHTELSIPKCIVSKTKTYSDNIPSQKLFDIFLDSYLFRDINDIFL